MKITRVVGYPLSSRYGDGNVLGQPLGVKSIALVEVHTDSGLVGLGETYCGIYVPEMIGPVVEFLGSRMIGMDPRNPARVCQEIEIPFVSRNGLVCNVYSAIDIALWDIKARAENRPLHEVLGSRGDTPLVYASGGSAAFSPDQIRADVEDAIARGFESFKMRVGHQTWERDLDRIAAARTALGSKRLMIDAIMGSINPPWTEAIARERIRDMARFSPWWVEEPLHPSNLEGLVGLHRDSPVRIATGEALAGALEYAVYLGSGAVDIMQLDVTHCGGITRAIEIAGRARSAGVPLAMHVWGSAIALAANAHFSAAFPEVEWLEIPLVDLAITAAMSFEGVRIDKGRAARPTAPGLGVVLPDDLVERFPFVSGSGWRI